MCDINVWHLYNVYSSMTRQYLCETIKKYKFIVSVDKYDYFML